jgi:hypothetical protein
MGRHLGLIGLTFGLHFGGNDINLESCGIFRHYFKEVISQIMIILPTGLALFGLVYHLVLSENKEDMDANQKK